MRVELLDHGYLELIETWGSEESIIEAARMSTGKGFQGWGEELCTQCGHPNREGPCPDGATDRGPCNVQYKPGDEKLLRFLWENAHATPFEMAGATFEVQAPIFVFREWHRHRVPFGYNEMSARYTPLPDVNYLPTVERLMAQGGSNKQAQSTGATLSIDDAQEFRGALVDMYRRAQELYEIALRHGVPKELARIHLPVGRYSRMRATGNLRGWLAFLKLREAHGAQYEIRVYANAVHTLLANKFPWTMSLFEEKK